MPAEVVDLVHVFVQHSEHPTRLESENCYGIVSNIDDDSSEGSLPPGYDSMDMGIPNVAGVGECSQNRDIILGDPLFPDKTPSLQTQTKGLPWLHRLLTWSMYLCNTLNTLPDLNLKIAME